MDNLWRLIVGYSARTILGIGALVFGAIAVKVGNDLWEFVAIFGFESVLRGRYDSGLLSLEKIGGPTIPMTKAEYFTGLTLILLVVGGLSVACAYFAFRSDKAKTPTD